MTAYFQTAILIKTLVQMGLVCYTANLYLWVSIELVYSFIHATILNRKSDRPILGSLHPPLWETR